MILGAYGPYGPPFKDPALQATYQREAAKLASSSAFITQDTANALVAGVVNSATAAVEAQTSDLEARARSAAERGARGGVTSLMLVLGLGAVAAGGVYYATR